jgi:hypothetical protein
MNGARRYMTWLPAQTPVYNARYDGITRAEEIAMRWKIGNVTVTRVVETELPTPGTFVLPDAVPENVTRIPWLVPNFAQPDGILLMSIHSLVVESQGKKIVVDTCLGNDKKRAIPDWNMRTGPFLQQLADAGHPRESVDTVVYAPARRPRGLNTMS